MQITAHNDVFYRQQCSRSLPPDSWRIELLGAPESVCEWYTAVYRYFGISSFSTRRLPTAGGALAAAADRTASQVRERARCWRWSNMFSAGLVNNSRLIPYFPRVTVAAWTATEFLMWK